MANSPMAFLSYVHADDEHEGGRLSQFRDMLSGEVRIQTGMDFPIFQDRSNLKWGENWKQRIEDSLDSATLLIPVITPGFFRSHACRDELSRFLQREHALNRSDLILPLYYVDCPALNDALKRADDPLMQAINASQYADWRELRFEPFTSSVVRRKVAILAKQIADALERTVEGSIERKSPSPVQELEPRFLKLTPCKKGSKLKFNLARVSWDMPSGKTGVLTHGNSVSALSISPDGRLLASAGGKDTDTYQKIRVWQISTGAQISEMNHACLPSRQHYRGYVVGMNFSSDCRILASVGGMRLHLWDVSSGKEIEKREYHHWYEKIPSGDIRLVLEYPGFDTVDYSIIDKLVTAMYDNIIIWRPNDQKILGTSQELGVGDIHIRTISLSTNGQFLAAGGQQTAKSAKTLMVYDLDNKHVICQPSLGGYIKCLKFSPDGSLLAIGGDGLIDWEGGYTDTLKLWDPKSGREICTLPGHDRSVSSLAFSLDSHYLVASGNGIISVWNMLDKSLVHKAVNDTGDGSVMFTASDCLMVVSADFSGKIKVWK